MRAHNKTMSYVGVVALAIGAAAPTVAQQTGLSCVAEIAQARARIAQALAAFPTPVDPSGPASGAGRELAGGFPTPADPLGPNPGVGRNVAQAPSPTIPENPIAGAGRTLAAGLPTPADPLGPNPGVGRSIALPQGEASGAGRGILLPQGEASGAGRELAGAAGPGTSGSRGRIQQAQALVGAAQTACDAGDSAAAVAKARQAVNILP